MWRCQKEESSNENLPQSTILVKHTTKFEVDVFTNTNHFSQQQQQIWRGRKLKLVWQNEFHLLPTKNKRLIIYYYDQNIYSEKEIKRENRK